MKLIADLFTRNETRGSSLVEDRTARLAAAPAAPAHRGGFSVHFGGASDAYDLWLSASEPDEAAGLPFDGLSLSWHRGPDGVARGQVCFRGAVVCDALSLDAPAGGQSGYTRRFLRAQGLSHGRAAVLATLSARPVLVTSGHGHTLPHEAVRQIHRMLIESLERWDRLSATAA